MTRKRPTQVAAIEDLVDKYEDHLGTYMVKVGSQQLSKNDSPYGLPAPSLHRRL